MATTSSSQVRYYTDRYETTSRSLRQEVMNSDNYELSLEEGWDVGGEFGLGSDASEYQSLSQGNQGERLSDEDLLGEMEKTMGESGETPFDAKQAIADLKDSVNQVENSAALDEETKEALNDKIRDIEKLIGKSGTNPEDLQEKIEELNDEIQGSIEAALDTRTEQISDLKEETGLLKNQIEKSRLSAANKNELSSQLAELEKELKKTTTTVEDLTKTFEDIQQAFRDTKPEWPAASVLANIPQNQSWGDQATGAGYGANDIAQSIAEAFATDDWQKVIDGLNMNVPYDTGEHEDQGVRNANNRNDIVRKIITGIFGAAGSREEGMELLKMIPRNVRELMLGFLSIELGESRIGDRWSTAGTASIIQESLATPLDSLDPPNSSQNVSQ